MCVMSSTSINPKPSCQALLSKQPAVRGHLMWRSHTLGKLQRLRIPIIFVVPWFQRYVIVYDHALFIYRDIHDSKPTSVVHLANCRLISRAGEISAGEMPWAFKMIIASSRSKDYYFAAESACDQKDWMDKLEACRKEAELAAGRAVAPYTPSISRPPSTESRSDTSSTKSDSDTDEEEDYAKIVDDETLSRIKLFNQVKKNIRGLPSVPQTKGNRKQSQAGGEKPGVGDPRPPQALPRPPQTPTPNGGNEPPDVVPRPAAPRPSVVRKQYEDTVLHRVQSDNTLRRVPAVPTPSPTLATLRAVPPAPSRSLAFVNVMPYTLNESSLAQFYDSCVLWKDDREQAAKFLAQKSVEGSYLVRDSAQSNKSMVLVTVVNGEVKKYQIKDSINSVDGRLEYSIQSSCRFPSIARLVAHYTEYPLPGYTSKLLKAYGQLQ